MAAATARNHTVDVARALSVAIVVVFHGFIYQARMTPGGLEVVSWSPPRFVFWLSWLLMAMPMFFVCGGFANALIVDKMHQRGTGFAHYLANRGRRLTGGLVIFITFFAVVATIVAWTWNLPLAVQLSSSLMHLLWFISVYLVIVLFAPFLVRLHDRFGGWVMVVLVVGIVLVDRAIIGQGNMDVGQINMFLVWPLCHQLGIAYQRGWFRTGPLWRTWLALVAGAAGIVVLITHFGYPESAVGFGNMPVANHIPPTLAMALLGVSQAALLGLVERSGVLARLPERTEQRLARVNALMMTVYLWHVPCLVIGGGILIGLSMLVPALSSFFLAQPVVVAVGFLLVAVICPLVGLAEYKLIPQLGVRQDRDLALLAFCLTIVGCMLVWHFGTVFHPATFSSSIGVLAVWLGAFTMAEASRPIGVAKDGDDRLKPAPDKHELPAS